MELRWPTLEARAGQRLLPPLPVRLAPGWQSSPLRTWGAYTQLSGGGSGELDPSPSSRAATRVLRVAARRTSRSPDPGTALNVVSVGAAIGLAADELWRSRRS